MANRKRRDTTMSDVSNAAVRFVLSEIGAQLGGVSDEDRAAALAFFGNACAYTGAPLTMESASCDHAASLNRDHCGMDLPGNVVPSDKHTNERRKLGKHFREFLKDDPDRLVRIEEFRRTTRYS